jgi:hypothetical protein
MKNRQEPTSNNRYFSALTTDQINGMTYYGLSEQDVRSANYGSHTLDAMYNLLIEGTVSSYSAAFIKVKSLDQIQSQGVSIYGLSTEQVSHLSYGSHTLYGISSLFTRGEANSYQRAFEMIEGMNYEQILGITRYRLNSQQVRTTNFGGHILDAIDDLYVNNREFSYDDAFYRVRFLKQNQSEGIVFGFNRNEVEGQNYKEHTLNIIKSLILEGFNNNEAFTIAAELNSAQTSGMFNHGLRLEDVRTPTFGEHTLHAMILLVSINRVPNNREAFRLVSGLNEFQTRAISVYGFDRERVLNTEFSEAIVNVIGVLHDRIPNAGGSYLYDTAIHLLEEYQFRGIAENELTLEQIGIAMEEGEFKKKSPVDSWFRANHVDAIGHLRETKGMDCKRAYKEMKSLDSKQINGMIDFGLRLDQVQHSIFNRDKGILGKLIEQLFNEAGVEDAELNIPLDQKEKEKIRNLFDSKILLADMDQDTAHMQTDISITDNQMLSVLTEVSGFASMPVLDNQQSTEGEEILAGAIRRLAVTQSSWSDGPNFYPRSNSYYSFEDCKPPAEERIKPKTELVIEENIEQEVENSREENGAEFLRSIRAEDVLGIFDGIDIVLSSFLDFQEPPISPHFVPFRLEQRESFLNLADSRLTDKAPFNAPRPGDPSSNNTNKKRKGICR